MNKKYFKERERETKCLKTDTVLDSVSATDSEFQRVGPEYFRLDLNKSNLGMGTLSFLG